MVRTSGPANDNTCIIRSVTPFSPNTTLSFAFGGEFFEDQGTQFLGVHFTQLLPDVIAGAQFIDEVKPPRAAA
jgi:hypothetical protein